MASKHSKHDRPDKKDRRKNKTEDRIEKLQQRLAKAQVKLHEAQERRTGAISRGEQDLEKARRKIAQRVSKATEEVERRVAAVSRAESELIHLTAQTAHGDGQRGTQESRVTPIPWSQDEVSPSLPGNAPTPEQAADVLASEEAQADEELAVEEFPTPQNVVATLESIESRHAALDEAGFVPLEGDDHGGAGLYVPPGSEDSTGHDHDWHS